MNNRKQPNRRIRFLVALLYVAATIATGVCAWFAGGGAAARDASLSNAGSVLLPDDTMKTNGWKHVLGDALSSECDSGEYIYGSAECGDDKFPLWKAPEMLFATDTGMAGLFDKANQPGMLPGAGGPDAPEEHGESASAAADAVARNLREQQQWVAEIGFAVMNNLSRFRKHTLSMAGE